MCASKHTEQLITRKPELKWLKCSCSGRASQSATSERFGVFKRSFLIDCLEKFATRKEFVVLHKRHTQSTLTGATNSRDRVKPTQPAARASGDVAPVRFAAFTSFRGSDAAGKPSFQLDFSATCSQHENSCLYWFGELILSGTASNRAPSNSF